MWSAVWNIYVWKLLEISGPPQFLNNSVEEAGKEVEGQRHGHRKYSRNKNDLPAGTFLAPNTSFYSIYDGIYWCCNYTMSLEQFII